MTETPDDPQVLNLAAAVVIGLLAIIGISALFGYQWLLSQGVPFLTAFVALCVVEFVCGIGFVLAVLNLHEDLDG